MNNNQYADLVLNNSLGGTVSIIEVKSYPKLSESLKRETLYQLENYSEKLDSTPLRYYTILSTATGYIKDLKLGKEIEFDTSPILDAYLSREDRKVVNSNLLNSVYSNWLRDLSFGLRQPLTEPERKLQKFGFIDQIKNTSPWVEYALN